MKKLLICILLLSTSIFSKIEACGYYPYKEDIRFCFTQLKNFDFFEYSEFNYSTSSFRSKYINDVYPNIDSWFQYCNKKVSKEAIGEAVYEALLEDFNSSSKNKMIQFFYENNKHESINYLKFAKKCFNYNAWNIDPWERVLLSKIKKRGEMIKEAEKKSLQLKEVFLKRRYIFLAIRLAFYDLDKEAVIRLFDTYFAKEKKKDLVYYWSLYFRTKVEKEEALKSFYAAQVFANSQGKRHPVFKDFNLKIEEKEVLKYAKNNKEKANVYAIRAIKKHAKSLKDIQEVKKLDSNNKILPFLVLREVNKLEDWILTPYFSLFNPSLRKTTKEEEDNFSYQAIQERIKKDRKYAKELLTFIEALPIASKNKTAWRVLKIQLQYLTENYKGALQGITFLKKRGNLKEGVQNQIEQTKALCSIAFQKKGKAKITEEVAQVILKNKKEKKFIFALGRMLEYKGNKVDAALIYSANRIDNYTGNEEVYWKSTKNKRHCYKDYFDHYFDYINVVYSVEDVENLIAKIEKNKDKEDAFSVWKYKFIKKEIPKLNDLVGTMYVRRNELKKALTYFKKLEDSYWEKTAYLWSKIGKNGERDFENPFYKLNYTKRFMKEKEQFELNKKTVTTKLITYIEKAKRAKNKDYYYFLIANCYYNMTRYGNSWMMRRYKITDHQSPTPHDELEFRRGILAKKYYKLALKNAKNEKFKALCLKMIGRCEYFEQTNDNNNYLGYLDNAKNDSLFQHKKAYKKLKKMSTTHYDNLTGGNYCVWFEQYFKPSSED